VLSERLIYKGSAGWSTYGTFSIAARDVQQASSLSMLAQSTTGGSIDKLEACWTFSEE
jgi:hypothetical protein